VTDPHYAPEYDEAYRTRLSDLLSLFWETGEVEMIFFDDPELHKEVQIIVFDDQGQATESRKKLCQYANRNEPPGPRHIDHFHVRFKKP
jgi:hypothetical protein